MKVNIRHWDSIRQLFLKYLSPGYLLFVSLLILVVLPGSGNYKLSESAGGTYITIPPFKGIGTTAWVIIDHLSTQPYKILTYFKCYADCTVRGTMSKPYY